MQKKKDRIYQLGEATWILGTLVLAVLSFVHAGIPAAGYVDELLWGPKPRDQGIILEFLWLVIVPNTAAAPVFFIIWVSNRAFGRSNEDKGE